MIHSFPNQGFRPNIRPKPGEIFEPGAPGTQGARGAEGGFGAWAASLRAHWAASLRASRPQPVTGRRRGGEDHRR